MPLQSTAPFQSSLPCVAHAPHSRASIHYTCCPHGLAVQGSRLSHATPHSVPHISHLLFPTTHPTDNRTSLPTYSITNSRTSLTLHILHSYAPTSVSFILQLLLNTLLRLYTIRRPSLYRLTPLLMSAYFLTHHAHALIRAYLCIAHAIHISVRPLHSVPLTSSILTSVSMLL